MRPDLDLVEADPQEEARLLASIADWLRRFTPLAAMDAPDGAMLDIGGCAHLFDGEQAMIDAVERSLAAQGFYARCAVAPPIRRSPGRWRGSRRRAFWATTTIAARRKVLRHLPVAGLRISQRDRRRPARRSA